VTLLKIVGIILVIALLTFPAAIAGQFTNSIKKMMVIAILLGFLFTEAGLLISYLLNLPTGATIIILASICFVLTSLGRKIFSN